MISLSNSLCQYTLKYKLASVHRIITRHQTHSSYSTTHQRIYGIAVSQRLFYSSHLLLISSFFSPPLS